MKIRIQGNSLRLRLKKTEIGTFSTDKKVSDTISFGKSESSITYVLKQTMASEISSIYLDSVITVSIPVEIAQDWINTDLVSLKNNNTSPTLLIEKDFKCTSDGCLETEKEKNDSFQNPNK